MESTTEPMEAARPNDSSPEMRGSNGRFVKGHKRILPGSTPGKYKRKVSLWDARKILENAEYDPVMFLVEAVITGFLPPRPGEDAKKRTPVSNEERMRAARELLKYVLPSLSATQITGRDGGPIAVAKLDLTEIWKDPTLAAAAQTLSLAMTAQRPQQALPAASDDAIDAETEDA